MGAHGCDRPPKKSALVRLPPNSSGCALRYADPGSDGPSLPCAASVGGSVRFGAEALLLEAVVRIGRHVLEAVDRRRNHRL